MAKFFNNNFLSKIFEKFGEFKVFNGFEFLNIVSIDDLLDPKEGIGTTSVGKTKKFNYAEITQINAGGNILDLKTLNSEEKPEDSEETKEPSPEKKPGDKPEKENEPPKKEEPKKEESFNIGDRVQIISEDIGFAKGIINFISGSNVEVRVFNQNKLKFENVYTDKKNIRK